RPQAILDRWTVHEHALQDSTWELPSDDRRDQEKVPRRGIEALQSSEQHVLNAVRHIDRGGRLHESDLITTALDESAFLKRSQALFDEERVAVGLVVDEDLQF